MNVPGSNLLNIALRAIRSQTIQYYVYTGRAPDSVGREVATFASPVSILGSFQPVSRAVYQQYGLDVSKNYYMFYVQTNALALERNVSGDQIAFNGQRFQCQSETNWFAMDGWTGILVVRIDL